MDPESILSMLEPLRTPEAVPGWPPAPGWWVLAVLVLGLWGSGVSRLWLLYRRAAPLRAARQALQHLQAVEMSDAERASQLSILQRRLAIGVAGRQACAGLTGQAWADFLNSLTKNKATHFTAVLAEMAYRPEVGARDCADALKVTQQWINDLERPR
ncbi:MAG: DUF4381 domain-containing protein [Congregibacter sp.]|nr:DUF4381 domain-containing protein [Congregibacter sp.]